MIVSHIQKSVQDDLVRVSAQVQWEAGGQENREIFIETEEQFYHDLIPNPDAFLVGALVPAMHFGEQRMRV
jgi:hypothetical protein